jgi:hypothetical protein
MVEKMTALCLLCFHLSHDTTWKNQYRVLLGYPTEVRRYDICGTFDDEWASVGLLSEMLTCPSLNQTLLHKGWKSCWHLLM